MEFKLLSQGSYGCIFKPGMSCENNNPTTKYITKVQKQKEISEKETIIGKEIKKIVQYEKYFAPIVNTPDYIEVKATGDTGHKVYWTVDLKVTEVRYA